MGTPEKIKFPDNLYLEISNTKPLFKKVRLFDEGSFDPDIVIASNVPGIDAQEVIKEFVSRNPAINKMQVIVSSGFRGMIEPFNYSIIENGISQTSVAVKPATQVQQDSILVPCNFLLANSIIEFDLYASTKVSILFYADPLAGKKEDMWEKTLSLSGPNGTFTAVVLLLPSKIFSPLTHASMAGEEATEYVKQYTLKILVDNPDDKDNPIQFETYPFTLAKMDETLLPHQDAVMKMLQYYAHRDLTVKDTTDEVLAAAGFKKIA